MGKEDYKDVAQPYLKLYTGQQMAQAGLGTWKSEPGVVTDIVKLALRNGYRHIDCAAQYGNEAEVGQAFHDIFAEGVIKREDVFVASKLKNDDHEIVEKALDQTLKDLQLDYLDLYHVHWPLTHIFEVPELQPPMEDTWARLEKLQKAGKIRALGISNFSVKKTRDLLGYAKIKPAVNQVEIHPYWRNEAIKEFCQQQGIQLTAYSPLGSPDSVSAVGRAKEVPVLLEEPAVEQIAKKLGRDKGQVVLRWGIQSGHAIIPKSSNEGRVLGNLETLKFEIPSEDMKVLDSLSFQARMLDGTSVANLNPKGPYKNLDELWDGELSDYNRKMEKKMVPSPA